MKRNGLVVPPAPRSFEELKMERSFGNSNSNSNSNNNNNVSNDGAVAPVVEPSSLYSDRGSGPSAAPIESQGEVSALQRGSSEPARHRYDTGEDEGPAAPRSLGSYADASPPSHTSTTKAAAAAAAPHDIRGMSGAHGIDLSKSPTTAALAAGARAAGVGQPYFFSLKLPPTSAAHVPGPTRTPQHAATASMDNVTGEASFGATGDRRDRPAGFARTASAGSPHKLDEGATSTITPRIPAAQSTGSGPHGGPEEGDGQPSPCLLPRDVGPLQASQAPRARNRLPSGTHIRRRPRSVANRRSGNGLSIIVGGAGMMDSTENVTLMPDSVDYGSPTLAALDASGTAGGKGGFSTPSLRPRGTGATATSGPGAGGRGTGRARDVLPPGMRQGAAAGGAAGVPHRRRADPSPAPSRPPRARKAAAVIRANATPGTPALGAAAAPTISPSSPTQLDLPRQHQSGQQPTFHERSAVAAMASLGGASASQQQQHPMWSIPNSPGASSPLNGSLDNRFFLTNDKDALRSSVSAGNNSTHHQAPLNSSGTTLNDTRGGVATAAKPPSGRLVSNSTARTHTPRANAASVRGMEDNTPLRQDYAKLAEHYVELCAAVGELPNVEWVSGLQANESDASHAPQRENLGAATAERLSSSNYAATTGSSEVKDLNATLVGGLRDTPRANTNPPPQAATQQQQQLQQQALTPRGVARQRASGGVGTTTAVTPRARTPVAGRAKSPRGGAAPTSSSATAAKRSGSVGRITTLNRASILGSSQTHGSGAVHTPRTRGGATSGRSGRAGTTAAATPASASAGASSTPQDSMGEVYAQRVSRYCAEHLQPYVDNMKQIQHQRHALDEVLNAFVNIATAVIVPGTHGNASSTAASVEATRKSQTPLLANPTHITNSGSGGAAHSYRGPPDSGKGVRNAPSPVPSSLGTTPRKSSTSRASVAVSLPNTTASATAAIMNRRSATAASARAAFLTDGLQGVQGAVVSLLTSLADGAKLAHLPSADLPSPSHEEDLLSCNSQSLSKSSAFPHSYSAFAPLGPTASPSPPKLAAGPSTDSANNAVAPADRSQTLAQLSSPPAPPAISIAVPFLPLSTAINTAPAAEGAMRSPLSFTTQSNTKSHSTFEIGRPGAATSTTVCPPPIRFMDFVEAQEKEIAAQLSEVCEAVRTALGASGPLAESGGATQPEEAHGTSGSAVQLEQADMLSNPFFVPKRYLQNLAATVASTYPDEEAVELGTPRLSSQADATHVRTGSKISASATTKSGKTSSKKSKSAKSTAGLGSSVSGETAGGTTGRTSTDSTPRNRASVSAFAPLFTVRLPTEDATPAVHHATHTTGDSSEPHRRSISSSSTENATMAAADASGSGGAEMFVLHCIQPPTASLTPRQSIDSDFANTPQNSTQFTVTDLGASAASAKSAGGGGGGKASKRATSANAGRRGSGAVQRSKSSGASQRAGTAGAAAGSSEPPRTTLAAPWLSSQGGRGNTGASASSPSTKKKNKKSGLNTTLSSSTAGGVTPPLSHSIGVTAGAAAAHHHHQRTLSHSVHGAMQAERQRQLAAAWTLWSALEQRFAASARGEAANATRPSTPDGGGAHDSVVLADTDGEVGEKTDEETQQFSLRPGTAPQNDTLSTSPRVRVGAANDHIAAASREGQDSTVTASNSTPPTAKTATAAATPAQTVIVEVLEVERAGQQMQSFVPSPDSKAHVGWGRDLAAPGPLGSQKSSPEKHLEGTVAPSRTAIFTDYPPLVKEEDEDDEESEDNATFSTTTARVAANMASLSNALRVPRKLDMEESALLTQLASKQSSQSTAPHTLSMTLPQQGALLSASALASDDVLGASGAASKQPTDEERRAARHIGEWWLRLRQRRASATQLRATHAEANERQRRRVLEARLRRFLLHCVCRQRMQRRLRAREAEQRNAQEARRERDAAAADGGETAGNASGTPRSTAAGSSGAKRPSRSPTASSAASGLTASTSREKFLRSKEQRKANSLATSAAAVTTTAAGSPASAVRVPPLPLASSGISTFAVAEYESDSSFTVSAIHRLLHAPPSLLYATCTAALHYPVHPPMAYLDNTRPAKPNSNEDERQQSEAPPDPDARLGAGAPSSVKVSSASHRRQQSQGQGGDAPNTLWRTTGVCFARFNDLRGYLCGEQEARVPPRTVPAAMDCAHVNAAAATSMSPLDSTLNSLATSYRGGSRQQTSTTMLLIPATMRYDSVVDPNELQQHKPVTKAFHRPFEQWGMAYNLTSRIFCAAAIYAWQLIFSHTPFDDAKQRELPTRDERQARLERVAERNDIILDCYGVRSEREWMREATKDLSFVGQIYMPNYGGDEPGQEREARDNYDFVKNFLFQCFPNINKLADIQDFLVGAGIFFVLKEVFHVSRDSPLTRRLQKYVPRILLNPGEDYLRAVTPISSPLYAGADDVGSDDDDDALRLGKLSAAPTSLATPRATDYGKGGNGLSGLQRAALQRYEQLRQLYHLSYGMLDEEERAACAWGRVPLADKSTQPQPQQSSSSSSPSKPRSPSAVGKSLKEKPRLLAMSAVEEKDRTAMAGTGSSICTNTSDDVAGAGANSPMRRYLAHSGTGAMTPLRATPTTTALSSAFNTPAAMREGPRRGSSALLKRPLSSAASLSATKRTVPPLEADIQLAHVPHRLLMSSVADAQFVREFEDEVSQSVHRIIDGVAGVGSDLSFTSTELPLALAAGADVHDALDIAYPEHFLVKLSEMLAFELFGLQVSLSSCEDLDSTAS